MEILYYESISNTNYALMELSKKSAKSWTALWTSNQTEGRGYAGNSWLAEPGKNIGLSLLIINELSYMELVFFNQWISNAVAEVLKKYTPEVFVKWPNDIIVSNKKVCGILIETRKSAGKLFIVSGIGLNVNQIDFDNFPKASSLGLITGQTYDLNQMTTDILTVLQENYALIENKCWQEISEKYESQLFKKDELCEFKTEQDFFRADIRGVSNQGELIVEMEDGGLKHFAHKSIELLY